MEEKTKKRKQTNTEEPLPIVGLYVIENPKRYERPRSVDGDEVVCVNENKRRMIRIGRQVLDGIRSQIISVIQEYRDVFAYTVDAMPSIDPQVMVHRLNIKEGYGLVR